LPDGDADAALANGAAWARELAALAFAEALAIEANEITWAGVWLVDIAVAIVVDAVANVGCRRHGALADDCA
jgi:hypothetical protein